MYRFLTFLLSALLCSIVYINSQQADIIKALNTHRVSAKVNSSSIVDLPELRQDYIEMCANESVPVEVKLKSTIIDLRVQLDVALEENENMRRALLVDSMGASSAVSTNSKHIAKKYRIYNLVLVRSVAVYYLDKISDEAAIKYTYSIISEINDALMELGIDPYDQKYIIPADNLHQFDINSIEIKDSNGNVYDY